MTLNLIENGHFLEIKTTVLEIISDKLLNVNKNQTSHTLPKNTIGKIANDGERVKTIK